MPKTPHSSLNLSRCSLASLAGADARADTIREKAALVADGLPGKVEEKEAHQIENRRRFENRLIRAGRQLLGLPAAGAIV